MLSRIYFIERPDYYAIKLRNLKQTIQYDNKPFSNFTKTMIRGFINFTKKSGYTTAPNLFKPSFTYAPNFYFATGLTQAQELRYLAKIVGTTVLLHPPNHLTAFHSILSIMMKSMSLVISD